MSRRVSRREIRSATKLRQLLTEYYRELDEESKKGKVAWCSSVGPAELLMAFGFKVYYPENHAAMLGAKRLSTGYIPVANAIGYSPEICSYLTSDVGSYLKNETPLSAAYGVDSVPKPAVIAYNTNQCRDVFEWFSFYSRRLGVPLIGIDSPKFLENVDEVHLTNVRGQLEKMASSLEDITGEDFDEGRLSEVVDLSLKASQLWRDILDSARNIPSPITFFDGTIHMAPAVMLRGETSAIDYYELLKEEMEERIESGTGAVEDERFRLYWEGMPIWGKLRSLSELFIEQKTCVVASTYCNSWIFDDLDPSDPLGSMALAYTELFINRSEDIREEILLEMVKKFKVDGIIFHDSRTCPWNSNARYGMPERLREEHDIPCLVLNADLNDLRCYSEEQTKTNVEAFVEQLEER